MPKTLYIQYDGLEITLQIHFNCYLYTMCLLYTVSLYRLAGLHHRHFEKVVHGRVLTNE